MRNILPAVSVVIPCYNGADYLREAVGSVLAQTFKSYEILIVDDGSTDQTPQIIAELAAAHPGRIRGIAQKNGGTASALNTGIRHAAGNLVAWLSHDDCFESDKLTIQTDFLASHPDCVGVYSDYTVIDAAGQINGLRRAPCYPPETAVRHFLQCVYINGSTLLIEKRCLEEAGLFDEGLRYTQDALMWARLLYRYRLGHVARPLTRYRMHARQGTGRRAAMRRDGYLWLDRIFAELGLEGIFPELSRAGMAPRNRAIAHLYLANVCVLCHRQLRLGMRQYRLSRQHWPGPRMVGNIARVALARAAWQAEQLLRRRSTALPYGEDDLLKCAERVPPVRFHIPHSPAVKT
jgi:glycosyltransferase involved in cell wall biosynthesis